VLCNTALPRVLLAGGAVVPQIRRIEIELLHARDRTMQYAIADKVIE
jgi:hypothetical protein